jgi:hypothetical protein
VNYLGCRCCCHVTQTTGVRQSVRSGEKFLSDPWLGMAASLDARHWLVVDSLTSPTHRRSFSGL